jgi:predicted nucleic acid-binding protein
MKELFEQFERKEMSEVKNLILLDTCFIFSTLDRESKLLGGFNYGLSSFTVEELLAVGHRLHKMKTRLRRFLKTYSFTIINTPVHIGDMKGEKQFVSSIDQELLKHIADPSDAVLLAVAIKTHSTVLTKDKHHLFTVELENYLRKYDLKVYKEMKDLNSP